MTDTPQKPPESLWVGTDGRDYHPVFLDAETAAEHGWNDADGASAPEYLRRDVHGKRMQAVISEREEIKRDMQREIDAGKRREVQQLEAIAILAGAGNVSPSELVQLGVGRVVENPNWSQGDDPRKRYSFTPMSLDDLRDMSEAAMRQQATVAKFRQIKDHFQQHQKAVSYVLDHIQKLTGKNKITGQDRDDLRNLRDTLSGMIGRNI